MTLPAAFLFDMDGLLLDTERLYMSIAVDLMAPLGVGQTETEAFFVTLVGSSGAHTQQRLQEFLPDGYTVQDFFGTWSVALEERLKDGIPLRPHVSDVLATLSGQGARMAVVTSTRGKQARHHLQIAGLIDHFEHVLGGDEVSANKPDPAPYIEAARALGVAPEACFAFEDSDRGLTSAVRAGCRAVQIPDLRPPDLPLPDLAQIVAPDLRAAMTELGVF